MSMVSGVVGGVNTRYLCERTEGINCTFEWYGGGRIVDDR
jgi:hypothetical protein